MKDSLRKACGKEMYKRDCLVTVSSRMRARIYGMPLVASRFRTKRGDTSSCSGQDGVNGNNITRDSIYTLRSALLKITK